ncbi:hypothetical protein [Frisingicoccus sp.]|uniref:hypothetical protein n=1 Tax=Frisingicoccus sp. TaxID=1918627 RepID=UPI002EB652FC|nr:hypothetical protein [Frisingicoccus sp.]
MVSSALIPVISILILLVVAIVINIFTVQRSYNRYKEGEQISGEVLMELEPSMKTKLFRWSYILLDIIVLAALYLRNVMTNSSLDIGYLICLIALLAMFPLRHKKQKLCTNGILLPECFVTWDNIKSIDPVDERDDKIKILLKKQENGTKKVTLYCTPEESLNILRMIERKMTPDIQF